ncbi:RNA-directed DNA polymerase, eukaryota, reverse transcriptase zinc-binding domain protein [Tanacetum coccineum]
MDESEAPSFTNPRPDSYTDDHNKNPVTYVKPPSISAYMPPRPVSTTNDHQQRDLMMAGDGHADEKSPPTLTQVGQRERSYRDEAVQDGAVVNQDRDKAPSFENVAGGKGKSEHDGYENRNENAPSQGAVRPLNHSIRDEGDDANADADVNADVDADVDADTDADANTNAMSFHRGFFNTKGGLGVSSLYALNRGLMIKWLWRFYAQNTSLWVRVVKAIHGEEGKVGQNISSRSYSCWLNIVKEVSVLQAKGVNVMNYVRLKLGNGESTSFWEDNWINGGVLKDVFPRLYALEMWGAEQSQLDILSDMVREVGLVPMSDRYIWSLEGSGDFSVASIRKVIDDKFLPNVSSKTRWVKYVPIKVNILAWKVKMEALPVRFNLSRRGIDIGSIVCPVCESEVETASHLFFKCSLLRQIARKVSSWWNVDYVGVNSYEEWFDWLGSLRLPAKLKLMLEGVFYVVLWYIWSHHNKTIFESKAPLKSIIFDDVISSSFYWCRFRSKSSFSWDEWLKNPYLIVL